MNRRIKLSLVFLTFVSIGSCKDKPSEPHVIGPPAAIVIIAGDNQSAPANTVLPAPIVVSVHDADGWGVPGQTVAFAVTAGGGAVSGSNTAVTDDHGNATAPAWQLGKSADEQILLASVGTITGNAQAVVKTSYSITIKFFGTGMTAAQQALFTSAAARIEGVITGDLPNIAAQPPPNNDVSDCTDGGVQTLDEAIDDVVIFASAHPIDGERGILGQAGPCAIRNTSIQTAFGVMNFDSADLDRMIADGIAQDVITHEMLHVLGIGTLWNLDCPSTCPAVHLLEGGGTSDPRYLGVNGRQGCLDVGGAATCAADVPVEGTSGTVGAGTADSHWRDATFDNELMTGFIEGVNNPLSLMTLKSLVDLGYVVNAADYDAYTVPGASLRAPHVMRDAAPWEDLHHVPLYRITANGRRTMIRPAR